ncbi:MAG: hypothetical protein J6B32_06315 [Spirochaetaceae bacterium]|nr:hypothetical protein [Spirochaetaceae bacterium]MBO5236705.1 hypothetical protein [Spirochaetaceae bacterium]
MKNRFFSYRPDFFVSLISFFIQIVFFVAFLLVFVSCGLETFYFLDPPINNRITENPSDPSERFFSFRTVTNSSSADIFTGTAVYYCLYNNYSTMTSNMASISNLIGEDYSDAAMNRVLNLGYQPIFLNDSDIIVPSSSGAVSVVIRLFTEGEYSAEVLINGSNVGVPLRTPLLTGFTFDPDKDNFPVPKETDGDVNYSSAFTEENTWYVAAYAVSIGRSLELTPVYSQVVPLGYLSFNYESNN